MFNILFLCAVQQRLQQGRVWGLVFFAVWCVCVCGGGGAVSTRSAAGCSWRLRGQMAFVEVTKEACPDKATCEELLAHWRGPCTRVLAFAAFDLI